MRRHRTRSKRYVGLGLEPVVESGAGAGAAISDEAFAAEDATIADLAVATNCG